MTPFCQRHDNHRRSGMAGGWQGRGRGSDLVAAVVTEVLLVGEADALEGCQPEGVVPEPGLVVAAEPTGLRDGRLVRAMRR